MLPEELCMLVTLIADLLPIFVDWIMHTIGC